MKFSLNKSQSFLFAVVATTLTVACQPTSNQDYSGHALVVDLSNTPYVDKSSKSMSVSSYDVPAVSSSTALESDVAITSNPEPVVVNTTVAPAIEPEPYANTATYTAASYSSKPQVGVVKPYIPDEADTKVVTTTKSTTTNVKPTVTETTSVSTPRSYKVVKGDTLYSIAFRYGLDYRALAKRNNIAPPYNIKVGQDLALDIKSSTAPVYIVKKGDTLYSIARNNGQSPSFLAGVNDLSAPYNLKVGQKLYLARVDSEPNVKKVEQKEVPVAGTTVTASNNKTSVQDVSKNVQTPIITGKTRKVGGVTWIWPTKGKVIKQFSLAEQGNKGIDVSGTRGQAISSAADGQVVYAGSALRGYGNLIIINHANEFLSAYAHNDVLLVKEGQKVKRGQQIAKMGSTDAESVRLHFEIRYRGQSVNPLSYLPK